MIISCRASEEEQCQTLPGDAMIPSPSGSWTHAITISSSPDVVWEWIVQMGADRAGWYSYDFIDNGGRQSAKEILPQFQEVSVGMVFPAIPKAKDAFIVSEVNPIHSIVLTVPGKGSIPIVTWSFVLVSSENSKTRLIARARMSGSWRDLARDSKSGDRILFINLVYRFLARLPVSLMVFIGGVGHGIMQKRMLKGIKRRAESRN